MLTAEFNINEAAEVWKEEGREEGEKRVISLLESGYSLNEIKSILRDDRVKLILEAIAKNPKITQKGIAIKTGLSARTVSQEIKSLINSGAVERVGGRAGYWEIVR